LSQEPKSELEQKNRMIIGLRPAPWLTELIEKRMSKHNENKTDAIHGLIKDLQLKAETLETKNNELQGLVEFYRSQKPQQPQEASKPDVKNFNPPSIPAANLIECVYAGADHKTVMMLHKNWCAACSLNPQTDEMPCPKRRPRDAPKPTTAEIDKALEATTP